MTTALAIAAHPDDIEYFMSGTLLLLKDAGYAIHYLNIANGCCGTTQYDRQTIARIRRDEARRAAESVGASFHESICDDMAIFFDRPTLAKVAAVVRDVAPEILLTHSPDDYMEDHMNACRLAVTAAFARGMPNFPTDPPHPHVEGNVTIYHAQPYSHRDSLRRPVEPDFYVDVSRVIDRKVEMLSLHESQKRWLDESQGHDSYLQILRDLDAECGRMSGEFDYAEGWRRHLHLGYCQPSDDPLAVALADSITIGSQR